MRRIVITGMGVVSPLGNNVADFRQNLFAGICGIESVGFTYRNSEVRFPAAPVKDFKPEDWIDPKKASLLDRFSQFAVAAALQAVKDSGLTSDARTGRAHRRDHRHRRRRPEYA